VKKARFTDREQKLNYFRLIVETVLCDKEFCVGGITFAEKRLDGFRGITAQDVTKIEIKLYKMFESFK
jgi:hypothetical protein